MSAVKSIGGAQRRLASDTHLEWVRKNVKQPWFWLVVAIGSAYVLWFWPLIRSLPGTWLSGDGYYSHGFLIPFLSAYIVWKAWPRIRERKVSAGYLAIPFLVVSLFAVHIANKTDIRLIQSIGLIASLLCGVWFVLGWQWLKALFWPITYLLFAMPVWTMAIDSYTYPLQRISTRVAVQILEWTGFAPLREGETIIRLNRFVLDVDVPCSGFKLLLAVTAFVVLFVLIGRLRWYANVFLMALAVPLCLVINGLRIALVGMVGEQYGREAGLAFHDYSGYITLALCFFIFFKIARWLGWKD